MKELSLNILDILENSIHAGATRIHLILQEFIEKKGLKSKVSRLPGRDEIDEGIRENLIIEFYSR